MRALSGPAQALLDNRRAHHLAHLWSLERRDGVRVRATDHDVAIPYAGADYLPGGGATSTNTTRELGLEDPNKELRGVVKAGVVDAVDLFLRRWNAARVEELVVDWRFPWAGYITRDVFWIERVRFTAERWIAELVGAARWLRHPVGGTITRECGTELGDAFCKVDLAPLTVFNAAVDTATSQTAFTADTPTVPPGLGDDFFKDGEALWSTGANAGWISPIRSYTESGRAFTLHLATPYPITSGDLFVAKPGCDKTYATCGSRFANTDNYQGFLFVPGSNKTVKKPSNV